MTGSRSGIEYDVDNDKGGRGRQVGYSARGERGRKAEGCGWREEGTGTYHIERNDFF